MKEELSKLIHEAMFKYEELNGRDEVANAWEESKYVAGYILSVYELRNRNLDLFAPDTRKEGV